MKNDINAAAIWTSGRTTLYIAFLLALVTFLVYLPSLKNSFVSIDDYRYVPGNFSIRHIDLKFLKLILTTVIASNWHPLTMLSYAVDYAFWGVDPFGYHLVNIIFHSVNTSLVFLLTFRLMELKGQGLDGRLFTGIIAALLFGLHPIHVESVTWISERKDVLSGFFFLLSILAYIRYAKAPAILFYSASLVFFTLAAMSKPMAITLPIALLMLDFYPLERFVDLKGLFKKIFEKLPFFAVSLASALLTIWAQGTGGAIRDLGAIPLSMRVFISIRALVFYLYKMVFPAGLSPFYPPPQNTGLFSLEFLICLSIVLGITIFCALTLKRSKIFSVAWLYYVTTLLPVIGLIQVGDQAAADRYTYLPGLSPVILASVGLWRFFKGFPANTRRAAVTSLTLLLAAVLAILTIKQEAVWKDSLTLWSHEIKNYPGVAFIYNSRGLVYQERGENKPAIDDFSKAIELDPKYAYPYNNRGYTYQRMGDYQQAVKDYNKAIELDPDMPNPYNNRGLADYEQGKYKEAIEDFNRAVSVDPGFVNAYINRAPAMAETGRLKDAIESYDKALALDPYNAQVYRSRGFLYLSNDDYKKALADFKEALSLDNDPESYYGLGLAYLKTGDREKGLNSIKKASSMGFKEAEFFLESMQR